MQRTHINANLVVAVAETIAKCDFIVTVSRPINHQSLWNITVGESDWAAFLQLEAHSDDGTDAELSILDKNGIAERTITLRELIAGGHTSVKAALCKECPAPTLM